MSGEMQFNHYILAGIRNRPGRNLATIFCFAFIALIIFSGQFLLLGAGGSMNRGLSRMGADQAVVPTTSLALFPGHGVADSTVIVATWPSTFRTSDQRMEAIRNIRGVSRVSPQVYITTVRSPGLSSSDIDVIGIDPGTDFTVIPWLEHPLDHSLLPGEVIAGHSVTGAVSSPITLLCHRYILAGRLDSTHSSVDNTLFLRLDDAYALAGSEGALPPAAPRIAPGMVNAILVLDERSEDSETVEARIRRSLSDPDPSSSLSVVGSHFSLDPAARSIQGIPATLNLLSLFIVIGSLPLVALIAAMVAHERRREIGLLVSMGAKKPVVFFLVISESLVLAAAGGIIGVAAGLFTLVLLYLQGVLNSALQVTFIMPAPVQVAGMAGTAVLAVIIIGSIAALLPAYRSSVIRPYDAIRGAT